MLQEQFLIHFGMHTVEKSEDTLLMRGEGPQPFVEKCIKGEKKFLSAAFIAASMDDLKKFWGVEHVMLFSSGWMAGFGAIKVQFSIIIITVTIISLGSA